MRGANVSKIRMNCFYCINDYVKLHPLPCTDLKNYLENLMQHQLSMES